MVVSPAVRIQASGAPALGQVKELTRTVNAIINHEKYLKTLPVVL